MEDAKDSESDNMNSEEKKTVLINDAEDIDLQDQYDTESDSWTKQL